jgi:hypothetical protein
MRRHVSKLRVLAVPFEFTRHRRLYVGSGAWLFGWRQRFTSTEQRHIETHIQTRGEHSLGLVRLTGLPNRAAILHLYFSDRITSASAQGYVAGAGAPTLEFPASVNSSLT